MTGLLIGEALQNTPPPRHGQCETGIERVLRQEISEELLAHNWIAIPHVGKLGQRKQELVSAFDQLLLIEDSQPGQPQRLFLGLCGGVSALFQVGADYQS